MTVSSPLLESEQSDYFICKSRPTSCPGPQNQKPSRPALQTNGPNIQQPLPLAFALPSLESERTQSLPVFVGEEGGEGQGAGACTHLLTCSLLQK